MSRIPVCNCPGCTNIGVHAVPVFRRGERLAYFCDIHFRRDLPYSTKNNAMAGTGKAHGYTVGVEYEVSRATEKARIEFTASGYLPTADCTVAHEFKSPIMQGLNSLSKHCVTFERLIHEGELEVGNNCGTHFHVGNTEKLTAQKLEYIRRFYHSLFIPLCKAMRDNPQKTIALFGRDFTYYASPINEHSDPRAHCNFINMQHEHTIEFRLCKFVNAKQYMNCAKFCVDVANAVVNNFTEHFNDTPNDSRRYPNKTSYRKHKADVTAQKLVKLFEKYTANV